MTPDSPNTASSFDFVVELPDGSRSAVAQGEFRSLDGKLLFVRKGARLEIRCPRSKGIYAVEFAAPADAIPTKSSLNTSNAG